MRIIFFCGVLMTGCPSDPVREAFEDPAWCPTTAIELDTVLMWRKEAACEWQVGCSSTMTMEGCMAYVPPVSTTACRIDGCALRRCYEDWDPSTASCQASPPDDCNDVYVQECD